MKLSAALVSYINTKPFIEGLNRFFLPEELEIKLLPPSACAPELHAGRCDIALVPVGSLVDFTGVRLMKDHCIGADGPVDSVFLFSRVPVEEVTEVWLDPHSRSSNGLVRILMAYHWQRPVKYRQPSERQFEAITGTTASVAIGDRAYGLRSDFAHVYDLSTEWKRYTGLPFAFAVWAYWPERVGDASLVRLREALEWGRTHGKLAAHHWADEFGYTIPQAEKYLTETIQYTLNAPKHAALARYFRELKALGPIL